MRLAARHAEPIRRYLIGQSGRNEGWLCLRRGAGPATALEGGRSSQPHVSLVFCRSSSMLLGQVTHPRLVFSLVALTALTQVQGYPACAVPSLAWEGGYASANRRCGRSKGRWYAHQHHYSRAILLTDPDAPANSRRRREDAPGRDTSCVLSISRVRLGRLLRSTPPRPPTRCLAPAAFHPLPRTRQQHQRPPDTAQQAATHCHRPCIPPASDAAVVPVPGCLRKQSRHFPPPPRLAGPASE